MEMRDRRRRWDRWVWEYEGGDGMDSMRDEREKERKGRGGGEREQSQRSPLPYLLDRTIRIRAHIIRQLATGAPLPAPDPGRGAAAADRGRVFTMAHRVTSFSDLHPTPARRVGLDYQVMPVWVGWPGHPHECGE